MGNTAKIDLRITKCEDCPYVRLCSTNNAAWCIHEGSLKTNDGLSKPVNRDFVPSDCPFILARLQRALGVIENATEYQVPKKYLKAIAKRQKDDPNPKYGADHSFTHATRVIENGEKFISQLQKWCYCPETDVEKLRLLFKISAWLHDIGLADSPTNHASHSAEMAKNFLTKNCDIDQEDVDMIFYAVFNHSDGVGINSDNGLANMLAVTLIMADKLDFTAERVVRTMDKRLCELKKIKNMKFKIVGNSIDGATGAELSFQVRSDFNIQLFKDYKKVIQIPRWVTKKYLDLDTFVVYIYRETIDPKTKKTTTVREELDLNIVRS